MFTRKVLQNPKKKKKATIKGKAMMVPMNQALNFQNLNDRRGYPNHIVKQMD